jgi:hypothetical protein
MLNKPAADKGYTHVGCNKILICGYLCIIKIERGVHIPLVLFLDPFFFEATKGARLTRVAF